MAYDLSNHTTETQTVGPEDLAFSIFPHTKLVTQTEQVVLVMLFVAC